MGDLSNLGDLTNQLDLTKGSNLLNLNPLGAADSMNILNPLNSLSRNLQFQSEANNAAMRTYGELNQLSGYTSELFLKTMSDIIPGLKVLLQKFFPGLPDIDLSNITPPPEPSTEAQNIDLTMLMGPLAGPLAGFLGGKDGANPFKSLLGGSKLTESLGSLTKTGTGSELANPLTSLLGKGGNKQGVQLLYS